MAEREIYARGMASFGDMEVHPGLELREGDDVDHLTNWLQRQAAFAAARWEDNHLEICRQVEERILEVYPGRAYFIETEKEGRGVQVYQPFGMPREEKSCGHDSCPYC
jgi:hypothetical protein